MPNWCRNTLEVRGPEKDVCGWVDRAASLHHPELPPQPLCFEAFVKPPSRFASSSEMLVRWRHNNWGTKWEPNILDFKRRPGYALYRFHTPWAPPREWVVHVARQYPQLEFQLFYSEPGLQLEGELLLIDGQIADERELLEDSYA